MALRDQPYLPLFIQDIMTDEKLNECCASTHGIFIKGIMCLMHKSETYGKILLKQKFKQNESKEKNFACQLAKHLPYSVAEIEAALTELIHEGVCHYEEDFLVQKRMVSDNKISELRSKSGKTGGKKTQEKSKNFAKANNEAKGEANTEYAYEYETEDVNKKKEREKNFNHKPTENDIGKIDLTDVQIGSVIQAARLQRQATLTIEQVNGFFTVFKSQQFTGTKFYQDKGEIFSHFLNWMMKKDLSHGNSKNTQRPLTGAEELAASLRADYIAHG